MDLKATRENGSRELNWRCGAARRIRGRLGIAIGAYLVGKLIGGVLRPRLIRRQTPSFGRVVSKLISWGITTFGVLVAVTTALPSVKPVDIIAGLGVFSIALGFAFQDILSNLLAGLSLIIRQPSPKATRSR